jgi:hypothetical protein
MCRCIFVIRRRQITTCGFIVRSLPEDGFRSRRFTNVGEILGLLLQEQSRGDGCFLGMNQSGPVLLGPAQ